MESSETGSIDDSLDSKNLEASMEDIVVAKYEDCNSEVLASQNEEDQGGEEIYGYLEVRNNPGSEDATIILDSEGFNLNGQRLILTQNDDGNGIIVVVSEDPDGQPLEQTFGHASVLHSEEVNFEDGLKEHGALVMDEQSQGLEFIETEEVPQEHEERHVYIENSGGIINISNENPRSPINSVNIESPLWSVPNNAQLKNDSTEMLFIPNPTVVLAPEETKHRKLMQLACIAHELQSADQKSSTAVVSESAKDAESSLSEFETSVIVTQNEVEKDPNKDLVITNKEVKDSESTECLPSNNNKNNHLECNPKTVSKSVDVSSLLSCTSTRAVDNTVSVIHTTSPELQDYSLENQTKDSSPSDFSSVKNYHNTESELPPEMLYSSRISRVSLHDSLDEEEPSDSKQLESGTREDLEANSQLSIAEDSNDSKSVRANVADRELELDCSPDDDDDSPITFIEKTQKLDGVDTLGIEDNPLGEAEADIRVDDDDSHAGSCIVIVEDDESKEADEDSNPSVTTRDNFPAAESPLLKDSDINQRTPLRKDEVPADVDSDLSTSDNDDMGNHEHGASTSKSDLPFLDTKYLYKYKSKAKKTYLTKNSILSPGLQDNGMPETNCQYDSSEPNDDNGITKIEESKCEPMDFEDSPADNLDSDLVIAENTEDEEFNCSTNDCSSVKNTSENFTFGDELESNSAKNAEKLESDKSVSAEINSENSKPDLDVDILSSSQSVDEESKNENSSVKDVPSNLDSSVADDFSYNEEALVKTPIKTYIRQKVKKSVVESKPSIKEHIELFSPDDFNFSECDKDINDVENSLNSDQHKERVSSSQENNPESDDHLLLSDVQSKVSATYNRKKKFFPSVKQGLRTRTLRPRSLPVKLPLENGTQTQSDSDSKKNSFDSSSSENLPWGDVLMSTSFQPCSETNTDEPSTSFASQSCIETSTPVLSPEQRKRKLNKYTRDFDRLLHSSPVRSKKLKMSTKRHISRGRKKIFKSRRSSSSFSDYPGACESTHQYNVGASTSTSGHRSSREVKKATIQYLNQNTVKYPEEPLKQEEETFSCSSCTFVSKRVNNLIEHLKYCKGQAVQTVPYSVNDMDKRQRIRGVDSTEKKDADDTTGCNGAVRNERRNSSQGEFSGGCQNQDPDRSLGVEDGLSPDKNEKCHYGFNEDDVVWAKYNDRFWPALVCEVKSSKVHVRFINHPEVVGLKVKHENIRTFDDSKWNLLCLKEAEILPNHNSLLLSVHLAESFIRRKKIFGFKCGGKTYFAVGDEIDFPTDSASSDNFEGDDSDDEEDRLSVLSARFPPPARKLRYEKLDKDGILTYLLDGNVDKYVVDIFKKKERSEKHTKYFNQDEKAELQYRPWFGPFEEKSEKEDLLFHFRGLFLRELATESLEAKFNKTAYVSQVWIPEAIVKAISVVNNISKKDAETLFESDDNSDVDCGPEPADDHKVCS